MDRSGEVICSNIDVKRQVAKYRNLPQGGGHGTRTRNPLRGTSFPMKPLAIRLPSSSQANASRTTLGAIFRPTQRGVSIVANRSAFVHSTPGVSWRNIRSKAYRNICPRPTASKAFLKCRI